MAISITDASEASEFFSADETLIRSFDNLYLGSHQKKGLNDLSELGFFEGNKVSDNYLPREEFDGGVCQLRYSIEPGGLGSGGNLSSVKKCVNPGLTSTSKSLDFCNLYGYENGVVDDDLCEWKTQERSSSFSIRCNESSSGSAARKSLRGKDCVSVDDSVDVCTYGLPKDVRDTGFEELGEVGSHLCCGGEDSCPECMWEFASKMKCNEVVYIARSKEGSQFLQNMLAVGDEETANVVFEGVYANIFEVMIDQYGQHLFHKTFDSSTLSQQEKLVLKMMSDKTLLVNVAKTQHGSHSLQKLVKKLKSSPLVKYIASALALDIKALMISQYGKHVIHQCFILLDIPKCQKLYEALLSCCIELATDIVGCTALNNSISNVKGPYRDRLLSILVANSAFLSQDPSGNFVLQYILSLSNPMLSKKICCHLQGQFIHLSLHKSGSHLVEKCLKSPGMDCVITDLLANHKQLLQLARDQFGNYVLQTALKVAKCHDSKMHQFLLQALEPHVSYIKYHPIGRNVFNVINSGTPLPKWGKEMSSMGQALSDRKYKRSCEHV